MPEIEDAHEATQGEPSTEPDGAAAGDISDTGGEDSEGIVHRLQPDSGPDEHTTGDGWRNLHRMMDVPLSLTVELGSTELPLSEVLRLDAGSVITLDRLPGEPIDLLINGRVFARGEVVVINDTFGYRITELVQDDESAMEIGGDEG